MEIFHTFFTLLVPEHKKHQMDNLMKRIILKILMMKTWNELLTLTCGTQLQLLLLCVGQLGHRLLAEESIQVPFVPGIGHTHQDGEEEES